MTDRELMQQALDALEAMQMYAREEEKGLRICDEAIEALRARLAQPESYKQPEDDRLLMQAYQAIHNKQPEPEPVAWRFRTGTWWNREAHWRYVLSLEGTEGLQGLEPLYTAPPQREWQGLTDEEKQVAYSMFDTMSAIGFLQAIEAKLKEKNT